MTDAQTSVVLIDSSVDYSVSAWLHEKAGLSGSSETERRYRQTMERFRDGLHRKGWELTSDRRVVRQAAQGFAEFSPSGKPISASTHNQRLSVLSSFYEYVLRHELLSVDKNPIEGCAWRKVSSSSSVAPLDIAEVRRDLEAIDRSTLVGMRDLAVLVLTLATGRRVTEVANLRLTDIEDKGGKLTIHWRRTKGGKTAKNELDTVTSSVLREYLSGMAPLYDLSSGTIWKSFAWNGSGGASLGANGLRHICELRLGTAQFHRLRHTFAFQMNEAGAKITDIQAWLGHTSIAVTGRYMQSLQPATNAHIPMLMAKLGIQ